MATSSIAKRFAKAMKLTLGFFAAQMGLLFLTRDVADIVGILLAQIGVATLYLAIIAPPATPTQVSSVSQHRGH